MSTIRQKHTTETIKSRLSEIKDFSLVEDFQYKNQYQKIVLKHLTCGIVFSSSIQNFLNLGSRCPNKECILKRIKETNIKKYGVENVFQNKEIQEKSRNINIQKYGVEHPQQNKKIRQKGIDTTLLKYGVNNVLKLKENRDKCKQANLKNIEQIKNKRKQTFLKKYGVESFPLSSLFLEKTKQTNLKRYGVEWCQQNLKINNKTSTTRKENYYNNTILCLEQKHNIKPLFLIENYEGIKGKILKFQCINCEFIFEQRIDSTKPIPRCHKCLPINKSKLELEIIQFIKNYFPDVQNNKKFGRIELDIFISTLNIGFEFDGIYWHSENAGNKDKVYHVEKNLYFSKQGITIFHIWENEWNKKQDIVKSIILNKIGKTPNKIYARKLHVTSIDNKTATSFFEANHMQGKCQSSVNIGLIDENNILYSCISFSKSRFNKKYEWEITRFSSLLNCSVVGGFSKLMSFFIKTYSPKSIITYADKRYSNGELYSKNGFTYIGDSKPNYFYTKDYTTLENRIGYQKHKLHSLLDVYDTSLTEWENMKHNGFDRIWDVGNMVFEWREKLV